MKFAKCDLDNKGFERLTNIFLQKQKNHSKVLNRLVKQLSETGFPYVIIVLIKR